MVVYDSGYVSCKKEDEEYSPNHLSIKANEKVTIVITDNLRYIWKIVKYKVLLATMIDRLMHKVHLINIYIVLVYTYYST